MCVCVRVLEWCRYFQRSKIIKCISKDILNSLEHAISNAAQCYMENKSCVPKNSNGFDKLEDGREKIQ